LLFERPQRRTFLINHHSRHLQSVSELERWTSCLHIHNNLRRSSWIFWDFDHISYAIQWVCCSKFSSFLRTFQNMLITVSDSDELESCELIFDIVKSINANERKSSDYDIAREWVSGRWYVKYFQWSAIQSSAEIVSKSSIVNEFKVLGDYPNSCLRTTQWNTKFLPFICTVFASSYRSIDGWNHFTTCSEFQYFSPRSGLIAWSAFSNS
jgi:hypothetical protein